MKITLTPSTSQIGKPLDQMSKEITISLPTDDLDIYAAMELACSALIAYGFAPESVADCLDEEFAEFNMGIKKTDPVNPLDYTGSPPVTVTGPANPLDYTGSPASAPGAITFEGIPEKLTDEDVKKFEEDQKKKWSDHVQKPCTWALEASQSGQREDDRMADSDS